MIIVFDSYLSDDDMISAASFKFREAIISPSALMTLIVLYTMKCFSENKLTLALDFFSASASAAMDL